MFKKVINSTTLTSEAADRLFSNISDAAVMDCSFLATLRALLRTRLPQDENVQIYHRVLYGSGDSMLSMRPSRFMDMFATETSRGLIPSKHNISIVSAINAEAGEKMLEKLRATAGKGKRYMSNYTQREDLRIFYGKHMKALFYTDDTGRNTIIFVDRIEIRHFHILQMMIPKYLPSLFSGSPLNEKETALLKSTGSKSSASYEVLIEEFAKDLDLRAEIIRSKLTGFETAFEKARAEELKREISRYQSDYDSYLSRLRDISQKAQDCKYMLAGLECSINGHSGDSELMEYFMCNKNLCIVRVDGTVIEFISHGYADVYDEEAFERYVGNHSGYMYSNINPSVTKPQMEMLYRSIFGGGKYRLRMCAAYRAGIKTGLSASRGYIFPAESNTYLPNPHIQFNGCTGSYSARFQEYMSNHDYVGAIDQATVSGRNLNFYDSSVMATFGRELSRSKIKCIEKPDGTLLTPMGAIIELERGAACQDQ